MIDLDQYNLIHDDPPCQAILINGYCPDCKLVPDMQSTAYVLKYPVLGDPVVEKARNTALKSAIYAGSFDPFTFGHLSIVKKALDIFDALHIVIAHNPDKKGFLSYKKRQESILNVVHHDLKLKDEDQVIVSLHNGLLAYYASDHGISHLVRGLRPLGDFESEYNMAMINHDLNEDNTLETVFLLADPATAHMSSTLVREVLKHKGNIQRFVPKGVLRTLKEENLT